MKSSITTTQTSSSSHRRTLPLLAAALAFFIALQPGAISLLRASAADGNDEAEDEATEGASSPEPGSRVFTNDDLRRYRPLAKASKPAAIVVDMTAPRPGKEPAPAGMDPAGRERRMEAIPEEIRQAEERLRAVDIRTRSVQNPFLPRPKLTEDEKHAEAGLDSRQILEGLTAERAALQATLTELRAEQQALTRASAEAAAAGAGGESRAAAGADNTGAPVVEPPRP